MLEHLFRKIKIKKAEYDVYIRLFTEGSIFNPLIVEKKHLQNGQQKNGFLLLKRWLKYQIGLPIHAQFYACMPLQPASEGVVFFNLRQIRDAQKGH